MEMKSRIEYMKVRCWSGLTDLVAAQVERLEQFGGDKELGGQEHQPVAAEVEIAQALHHGKHLGRHLDQLEVSQLQNAGLFRLVQMLRQLITHISG